MSSFGKVELCGIDTAKLRHISQEETDALLLLSSRGDREARQKLIDGNLRLVLHVVKRFATRSENPDDLFQVGCLGLIKAIDRFDVHAGVRLSTYAVPMNRRLVKKTNLQFFDKFVKLSCNYYRNVVDYKQKRKERNTYYDDYSSAQRREMSLSGKYVSGILRSHRGKVFLY